MPGCVRKHAICGILFCIEELIWIGRNSIYTDHKYYKYHVKYDKADISVREYCRIKLS